MEPYLGEVRLMSYPLAPQQGSQVWLLCDGRKLPLQSFQALYALLGVQYGGDGRTFFNIPDLRGRIPINYGNATWNKTNYSYIVAQSGGAETVALTIAQTLQHTHTVAAANTVGTAPVPNSNFPATAATDANNITPLIYAPLTSQGSTTLVPDGVRSMGAGAGHNNIQPSCVLGYYICAAGGYYPNRP